MTPSVRASYVHHLTSGRQRITKMVFIFDITPVPTSTTIPFHIYSLMLASYIRWIGRSSSASSSACNQFGLRSLDTKSQTKSRLLLYRITTKSHLRHFSLPLSTSVAPLESCHMLGRGGVDDTRLEAMAKTKDTKKSEAKAKNSPFEDRRSPGYGQECLRPRPRTKIQAQGLSKKKKTEKKRSSQKFFRRSPEKNVFLKIFQTLHKILTIQKLCSPRTKDGPIFKDLRLRGQGLQNESSRTSSRPRTSSRTPPLMLGL